LGERTVAVGDAVFVGDTLFMPDYGTARTDFPGGCAHRLYGSIHKLLTLPPETRLFMCHDYKAPGRDSFAWETTVAEERAANVHVGRRATAAGNSPANHFFIRHELGCCDRIRGELWAEFLDMFRGDTASPSRMTGRW